MKPTTHAQRDRGARSAEASRQRRWIGLQRPGSPPSRPGRSQARRVAHGIRLAATTPRPSARTSGARTLPWQPWAQQCSRNRASTCAPGHSSSNRRSSAVWLRHAGVPCATYECAPQRLHRAGSLEAGIPAMCKMPAPLIGELHVVDGSAVIQSRERSEDARRLPMQWRVRVCPGWRMLAQVGQPALIALGIDLDQSHVRKLPLKRAEIDRHIDHHQGRAPLVGLAERAQHVEHGSAGAACGIRKQARGYEDKAAHSDPQKLLSRRATTPSPEGVGHHISSPPIVIIFLVA
jgi:hypothetical protein